jgi:hypothetical protein
MLKIIGPRGGDRYYKEIQDVPELFEQNLIPISRARYVLDQIIQKHGNQVFLLFDAGYENINCTVYKRTKK